jgi:hypothetical protein
MSFPLPSDSLDRELVFEFFWKFSAFECALKRSGFLRKKKSAEADWERFGAQINGKFSTLGSPSFDEAVTKIKRLSPRRQMNNNGELAWEHVEQKADESDAAYTLHLLKTVRNNLFHGGKYPDGPIFEIARNREILRAALTVLDGCYELHPDIMHWIQEIAA